MAIERDILRCRTESLHHAADCLLRLEHGKLVHLLENSVDQIYHYSQIAISDVFGRNQRCAI
jgi:hypothetical protein